MIETPTTEVCGADYYRNRVIAAFDMAACAVKQMRQGEKTYRDAIGREAYVVGRGRRRRIVFDRFLIIDGERIVNGVDGKTGEIARKATPRAVRRIKVREAKALSKAYRAATKSAEREA
jgi:hypothetical protein